MAEAKFTVAICGGGIGGLALAIALGKYPEIKVDIYEATSQFTEVGAGIGVWPRVWRILEQLGLSEDLAKITALRPAYDLVDTFHFRKSDQAQGIDFYTLRTEGSFLRYHRPDFLNVLVKHIPAWHQVYFSKRLASYTTDINEQTTLSFTDGSEARCDLLVGADGIKSVVRRILLTDASDMATAQGHVHKAGELQDAVHPEWTGVVAYRGLAPTAKLRAYREAHPELGDSIRIPEETSLPTMYMGKNVNVVVYPISSGKFINVGCFHTRHELAGTPFQEEWVKKCDIKEVLDIHGHWEPEVQAIIQCLDEASVSRWAVHAVKTPIWVSNRVALIGDSAHAMQPQQASGAGQAIEDAFVLSTLLGHQLTTKKNLATALTIYETVRKPVATEVAWRSAFNGRLFGLELPGVDLQAQPERLPELGEAIKENWKWSWMTTIDSSIKAATDMLERVS